MYYVIDSNVFAKLVLSEDFSENSASLIGKIVKNDDCILVPDIFLYELIGILRKNKISSDVINDFIESYLKLLKIVPLDQELIANALKISQMGNQKSGFPSFYDSVYHALAMKNNCDLITADEKHEAKVKKLGHIRLLSKVKIS